MSKPKINKLEHLKKLCEVTLTCCNCGSQLIGTEEKHSPLPFKTAVAELVVLLEKAMNQLNDCLIVGETKKVLNEIKKELGMEIKKK